MLSIHYIGYLNFNPILVESNLIVKDNKTKSGALGGLQQ